MQKKCIAFIGGGNMAFSLIGGLINNGYDSNCIWVSNPGKEKLEKIQTAFQVNVTEDNNEAIKQADVVVFAVKPAVITQVLDEVKNMVAEKKPLLISVAAGVAMKTFEKYVGKQHSIIRAMPNTPAMLGCGMTSLFANENVTSEEKTIAENILQAVGMVIWLATEDKINTATAVAGSGPAYFFLVMEAMQAAGEALGLTHEEARLLVLQTALGASRMAIETDEEISELRKQVTSPNGTTEKALNTLMAGDLTELFKQAVFAAKKRAEELAENAE